MIRVGDLYACEDRACGFEILVVRDPANSRRRAAHPMCCCGKPMVPLP
jgi:hypothetical protein